MILEALSIDAGKSNKANILQELHKITQTLEIPDVLKPLVRKRGMKEKRELKDFAEWLRRVFEDLPYKIKSGRNSRFDLVAREIMQSVDWDGPSELSRRLNRTSFTQD